MGKLSKRGRAGEGEAEGIGNESAGASAEGRATTEQLRRCQLLFICSSFPNLNSWRRCLNHMSSHVVRAIAQYSVLALDLATTSCFLLFQDIRLPPMKTQYPEVERLSVGEPAQSASV